MLQLNEYTPACMEYVTGSGQAVAIQPNGNTVSYNTFLVTTPPAQANPPYTPPYQLEYPYLRALNAGGPPIGNSSGNGSMTLTAQYEVNYPAGNLATGGFDAYTYPSVDVWAAPPASDWLTERENGRTGHGGAGDVMTPAGLTSSGPAITVTGGTSAPGVPTDLELDPTSAAPGQDVTVSGTAGANTDHVLVTVGGTAVTCASAGIDPSGHFSCTFPAPATGGQVEVAGGNAVGTGDTADAGILTVTSTPTTVPARPTNLALSPATADAGAPVTVTGTAAGADTVTVTIGGTAMACTPNTVDPATGAFSCTFPAPATDGKVKVAGTNTVGTGNTSDAGTLTINGNGNGNSGSLSGLGSSDGSLSSLFG